MKTLTSINRTIVFGLVAALFSIGALGMTSTAQAQVVTTTTVSSSFAEQLAEIIRQIQVIQSLLNEQIAAEAEGDTGVVIEDPAPETDGVDPVTTEVDVDSVTGVAQVLESEVNADLQFLRDCFFTVDDVECEAADLSGDGVVNAIDLGRFKASGQYDLSGDEVVDLSDDSADMVLLQGCFFVDDLGDCADADFNNDDSVNATDLGLLQSAEEFDFNGDGYVDLRDDSEAS